MWHHDGESLALLRGRRWNLPSLVPNCRLESMNLDLQPKLRDVEGSETAGPRHALQPAFSAKGWRHQL
jgi:hypothetical protein